MQPNAFRKIDPAVTRGLGRLKETVAPTGATPRISPVGRSRRRLDRWEYALDAARRFRSLKRSRRKSKSRPQAAPDSQDPRGRIIDLRV